ncbi:MAG: major capsid protein [Actinobacteria bacterium]|nr:major capsid protein [Actinomycetota bacterium]
MQLGDTASRMFKSATPSQLQSMVASAGRNGQDLYQRNGIAEFRMDFPEDLIAYGSDDTEVFERAADQARLPGGSLLAAGGWCAPSETMYDLCDLPCSLDGILSLPEVGAPRGGVRWTKGLDFCEIYNSPGFFHYTETEMEANPTKPCMEIPCVDFDECRLDVDGLCITADIPQARAYPEIVAQFIQGAMCAHAHRVNGRKLNTISAGSTNDGSITQAGYGAVANVLYAIELEIQAYRYRGRRAQEGTPAILELVAPYWIKAVLRSDIANRNAPSGVGNPLMVTDADITAWFASRGVAVRFVYDWQDLIDCTTVVGPPATDPNRPITDYPNTVEFMLYEAGTWIVPTMDVITLESLYDSTLIKQNKYTALFTEQAFCVVNRCNGSRRFQVPICATGNTGAQVAVVCA